jgi:serine/threonine protein kinase
MQRICPACKTRYEDGEVFCPNDGARLTTQSQLEAPAKSDPGDPLVGSVLQGRYRIHRKIGEGGMGLVYEAEHVAIEKRVALKVLRDDFSSRPEVVERFRQEAKSASRIGNEHIVDISDFGETPRGAAYFVMELLEGEDLADVIDRLGQLPLTRAADILLQCCRALSAAHAKGIVHRDMKPENIFLTTRDERPDFVKIVDFGIAKMSDIETKGAPGRKLTKTGMIFGTPEYMSPEQAAGRPLDHRVDIYALAVILFEMLTGTVPFVGDTFMGVLTQHMFEDPPSPVDICPGLWVPEGILEFIARGLAKDPAARFQTCGEMEEALRTALSGRSLGTKTHVGFGDDVGMRVSPSSPPVLELSPGLSFADTDSTELTQSSDDATGRATLNDVTGPVTLDDIDGAVPVEPPRPSRGPAFAVVGGLVLGVAILGGAYAAFGSGEAEAPPPAEAEAEAPLAGDPEEAPPEEAAAVEAPAEPEPVAEVDAGPAMVEVFVQTMPAPAEISVEGVGVVCEESPCTFESPLGQPIEVVARSGRHLMGRGELTPSEDRAGSTLMLPLRRRRPGRPRGRTGGSAEADEDPPPRAGGRGRHDPATDLMTPPIFQK